MKHQLVAAFFTLASAVAQAGVGLLQLPVTGADGPVTVYYPSSGENRPVQRGPFTLEAVPEGEPLRGNGRLVVISHGSGGNAWVNYDAARALVETGFVVALPQHRGDNAQEPSQPGPESWKLRPAEVSRAIDAVARDPRFASLLSFDKVGMYGMSAGGHTALSLAGGAWSPAGFRKHCEAHIAEDFPACVGLITSLHGDFMDGLKKTVALGVIRQRFDDDHAYTYEDPRVRAVVAGVPFAADFDPASLVTPRIPLGMITAAHDRWLSPRFHSGAVLAACKGCERIADLSTAGHGALLSPPPPLDRLGAIAKDLLADPPGFDRAEVVRAHAGIVAFMRRHLLP